MKTLDEVIKALEYCLNPVDNFGNCNAECPYIHCCDPSNHDVTEDALNYLKEYRDYAKAVDERYAEIEKKHKDAYFMFVNAVADLEDNPALSWDELKTMTGKPVWIEMGACKIWGLNDGVYVDAFGKEMVTIKVLHDLWHLRKEKMGIDWQAYRKERQNVQS